MNTASRWLTILVLIVSVFLVSAQNTYAAVCACYFGPHNDCVEAFVAWPAVTSKCQAACEKEVVGTLNKISFAPTTDTGFQEVSTSAACNAAHTEALIAAEKKKVPDPKSATSKTVQKTITPDLNVDIPGFKLSDAAIKNGVLEATFLGEYVSAVYNYLVWGSVSIAIVFIMIAGLQYSFGKLSPNQLSSAKERIKNAVIGLALMLSVHVILVTINPALLNFDALKLALIAEIPPEAYSDPGDVAPEGSLPDVSSPTGGGGKSTCKENVPNRICSSKKACVQWCNNNPNPATWPTCNKKTIDPSFVGRIPDTPGVKNVRRIKATKEMQDAVKRAGEIAVSMNPNYVIKLRSGWRPMKTQIKLVCNRVKSGNIGGIGGVVAYPGGSNHGSGFAFDVQLWEGSKQIVTSSNAAQRQKRWRDGSKILDEIMGKAGFVRYAAEIWHYELAGKTTTRCRCNPLQGKGCPFPAPHSSQCGSPSKWKYE